jgi:hypothetical protein
MRQRYKQEIRALRKYLGVPDAPQKKMKCKECSTVFPVLCLEIGIRPEKCMNCGSVGIEEYSWNAKKKIKKIARIPIYPIKKVLSLVGFPLWVLVNFLLIPIKLLHAVVWLVKYGALFAFSKKANLIEKETKKKNETQRSKCSEEFETKRDAQEKAEKLSKEIEEAKEESRSNRTVNYHINDQGLRHDDGGASARTFGGRSFP